MSSPEKYYTFYIVLTCIMIFYPVVYPVPADKKKTGLCKPVLESKFFVNPKKQHPGR